MTPLTLPLNRKAIERILPHRYPFLFIDRVVELDPDRRIVGVKNVAADEPYLTRAAGERPALPSMILTEAVAQLGAILVLTRPENQGRLILFMGIKRARVRGAAHAGDSVVLEAVVRSLRGPVGLLDGKARVDGRIVAEGAMTFALGPPVREDLVSV